MSRAVGLAWELSAQVQGGGYATARQVFFIFFLSILMFYERLVAWGSKQYAHMDTSSSDIPLLTCECTVLLRVSVGLSSRVGLETPAVALVAILPKIGFSILHSPNFKYIMCMQSDETLIITS